MLTIKDLSTSEVLDRKALAEVRGGNGDQTNIGTQAQQVTNFFGGAAIGVQTLNQANIDPDVFDIDRGHNRYYPYYPI